MCCTCSFSARPLPTRPCLTAAGVYSNTGISWITIALIAAPRAWPSFSADDDLLDSDFLGPPAREHVGNAAEGLTETDRELRTGGGDTAGVDVTAARTVALDQAETGDPGTRVDTEDAGQVAKDRFRIMRPAPP